MPLARSRDDRCRDLVQLEAPHQAAPTRFADARAPRGESIQAVAQPFTFGADVGEEIGLGNGAQDVEGHGCDERSTTERRGVIAGRHGCRYAIVDEDRSHRQPAAQGLREGVDVRYHAGPLGCEQRSGATEPALHFIEDERPTAGITQLAQIREEIARYGTNASLAL